MSPDAFSAEIDGGQSHLSSDQESVTEHHVRRWWAPKDSLKNANTRTKSSSAPKTTIFNACEYVTGNHGGILDSSGHFKEE